MFTPQGPMWRFMLLQLCAAVFIPAGLAADTPQGLATPVTGALLVDRKNWTATADSFAPDHDPAKVFDDDVNSFWQSADGAPLPHYVTVDMKSKYWINSVSYLPQQNTTTSLGNIQAHTIQLSLDGQSWGPPVALGTFRNDNSLKTTLFASASARYVRLSATSGDVAMASSIKVYATTFPPPADGLGRWGPTINFPLVPVAAAVEHDSGKVLVWSSHAADEFLNLPESPKGGKTVTGTYDPSTKTVSERTVSDTHHDMFCPGISTDASGRIVVTGGNDAPKTSVYDPSSAGWVSRPDMTFARGYQSQTTIADGRIFTIGGSWSGPKGGKYGEIYDPVANKWTGLPGCNVTALLTADREGVSKADNHAWLFAWKEGSVFQAGPSKQMNWYGVAGNGSQKTAGLRATDDHSMNGNAVMYDAVAGRILTVGGSINYAGSPSTSNAHIITITTPNNVPSVARLPNMNSARMYHNSVVLPDGTVFITGGQTGGASFTDDVSVLTPEKFDPATSSFSPLAGNVIPRNYHSVAMLLLDGTVFTGGGGLCGSCSANHFDGQIYTPQYLLNGGARPVIKSVSKTVVGVGGTFDVTTDAAVAKWSLIRYGSATHTVNTDQRRIPLTPANPTAGSLTYNFTLPADAGIILPGYYMLFAVSAKGVPSVATTIRVSN